MDIILNPMLLATIMMLVLCLLKVDVFFSITISSIACLLLGGVNVNDGFWTFIEGMGGNNEIVYGLLLMGMLGQVMEEIKMGEVLVPKLTRLIGNKVWLIPIVMLIMAVLSETVILIYVSFVPIFVPPLMKLFNKYKVDRRMLTTIVNGGLQIGYVCVPIGIGAVYMGIVQGAVVDNGLEVEFSQIAPASIPILIGLLIGVISAMVIFRKPRDYGYVDDAVTEDAVEVKDEPKMQPVHWLTLCSALIIVVVLFITNNIPLSATCGILFLGITTVIKPRGLTDKMVESVKLMGYGCIVLMAAAGFAAVTREYGQLDSLVSAVTAVLGGSKIMGAFFMLLLGLAVTMGIGTSFGTVPVVATVLVPLGLNLGMSPAAIIMLVSAAGALGDSGSPASENTLVCTAVFNADGKHDHIQDTCIPAFLCINIPIIVVCTIAAAII